MATLFEHNIYWDSREYRIAAEFNDKAIMEDRLSISIRGAVRESPNDPWREELIEIRSNFALDVLEVLLRGEVIGTIPLSLALPDAKDFVLDEIVIESGLETSVIEELLQLIPGDPIFGCMIKGAASAVIGQTIRCWRRTSPEARIKQRLRDIGGCLREYGGRMAMTFLYRFSRCALTLGVL